MVQVNFVIHFLAALIPLVIGAIWYNPKVFGNAWMKSAGLTEEQLKGSNMALIFGLTYIVSFFIAGGITPFVIHQLGAQSMLFPDVMEQGTEAHKTGMALMEQYGDSFRTFKHGALHGTILGITVALPIITIIALFERKKAKYVLIHAGYWVVSLALMGGVICQFA